MHSNPALAQNAEKRDSATVADATKVGQAGEPNEGVKHEGARRPAFRWTPLSQTASVIRHVGGYVGVLVGGRQFMLTPEEAKGLAKFLLHEAEQQAMDEAARQAATKSIQVNEEPLGEVGRCSCGGIFYELDELLNHVCIGHPMADDPWYAGNAPADAIQPEEQRQ